MQELIYLAPRAADIGRELAADLNKITREQKSKSKSLKTAARGMCDAKDIQKTEKRMHEIREGLQLKIVTDIKKKVDRLGNENQRHLRNVLGHIMNTQRESTSERQDIIKLLIQIEAAGSTRHYELVRLQKQLLEGITALPRSEPLGPVPAKSLLDDSLSQEEAKEAILDSLWYPSIRDREDSIRDAHVETFEWLFHDPVATEKNNFADFLQGDTKTFWITGKPGSGKSTLVKYLRDDPRTKQHLSTWLAGRRLVEASFYFFYNGRSDMQTSEYGCLVSLLHDLLNQRRDLITMVFKERFRRLCLQGKRGYLDNPTLHEARKAIKQLFVSDPDMKFFLTVDGLDESDPKFSTTHIESMVEFLKSLAKLPNVKMVLASRPLSPFDEAFADCPTLRIHEFTPPDICLYINERLEKHKDMQLILEREPGNTRELIESIVDGSSGVFLWVHLVVDSLIYGLTNYDGIHDLQRRVEELPRDIHDLYELMLLRVPISYRVQTMKLLKLAFHGTSHVELSVLGLRLAEEATDRMVIETSLEDMRDEDLETYYLEMERRLKSRCLGLIEIQPSAPRTVKAGEFYPTTDIYDLSNKFMNTQVKFLHRSVYEFLNEYNWATYIGADSADFDPFLPLLRSAILIIKKYRARNNGAETDLQKLLFPASYAGERARAAEHATGKSASVLLHTLDATMSAHLMKLRKMNEESLRFLMAKDPTGNEHWAAYYEILDMRMGFYNCGLSSLRARQSNFTSFATDYRLINYLKQEVATEGPGILQKPGLPLLGYALRNWKHLEGPWYEGVVFFHQMGFKYSEEFKGVSMWSWYIDNIPRGTMYMGGIKQAWLSISHIDTMTLLLHAGADPRKFLLWSDPPASIRKRQNITLSLLRAARLGIQICEACSPPDIDLMSSLKKLLAVLKERRADEQECHDVVLVYPPTSQGSTDVTAGQIIDELGSTADALPDAAAYSNKQGQAKFDAGNQTLASSKFRKA